MTILQKLEVIQKTLGISQTRLAERFGVSFVALHGWRTGKYVPRPKMQILIEELYLEVTGQKIISAQQLEEKKKSIAHISRSHKNVLKEILDNPDIRDEFILKLTFHSNRIEGSTLSEPETASVLFDNIALPNKSLIEQLEAKNHQTALNVVFDHVQQGGFIDEVFVLKLHGILMNGIQPDAGFFRRHAVRIVGVNLPTANYLKVPDLIRSVTEESIDVFTDPLKIVTAFHSRFEQIHPFSDGNGRIGRLLITAMLLKANLAPAVIRQEFKRLYYIFLLKSQTTDDQSQLEDFFCDAVLNGFSILERKNGKNN